VLFLGAHFETVLPFSLFVPGEAFLLGGAMLGGAMLAGAGALDLGAVAAALWAGGLLGLLVLARLRISRTGGATRSSGRGPVRSR
jgi:hypothetical protein